MGEQILGEGKAGLLLKTIHLLVLCLTRDLALLPWIKKNVDLY